MHHLVTDGGRHAEDVRNHLRVEEQRQFVIAFVGGFFQIIFPFIWSDLNWKLQSPCSRQKKNARQMFDLRLRISIEAACGAFETRLQEGNFDRENWFYQTDSQLEIQINLAYPLWKPISKPILLIGFAQSSWQRTLWWRCNYLNLWGQRDRSEMILQSKIQNNSSFRNRKTLLTGACRSKNHSRSCHSRSINRSLKLILK